MVLVALSSGEESPKKLLLRADLGTGQHLEQSASFPAFTGPSSVCFEDSFLSKYAPFQPPELFSKIECGIK